MSNYSCGCLRNDLQPAAIRNRILSLELGDGQSTVIAKDYDDRLLISYSVRRAKKDAHNCRRGLQRLEKRLKRGTTGGRGKLRPFS